MAARKDQDGGAVGQLVRWLAVPRLITLPVLLLLGAIVGWVLWQCVDSVKMLAWLSGLASPFCTMCATVIWAMRDKLDDAIDTEDMSATVYEKFDAISNAHRNRSTFMASIVALMSLVAAIPAISNQLIGPVWEASVIAASMAVATSIYGYQLANYWDMQIRRYKSQEVLKAKKLAAQNAALAEAAQLESPLPHVNSVGMGWSNGPSLSVSDGG